VRRACTNTRQAATQAQAIKPRTRQARRRHDEHGQRSRAGVISGAKDRRQRAKGQGSTGNRSQDETSKGKGAKAKGNKQWGKGHRVKGQTGGNKSRGISQGSRVNNGGNNQTNGARVGINKGARQRAKDKQRGNDGINKGGYPCTDAAGQNKFGNDSQIFFYVLTQSFKTIVRQ